MLGDHLVIEIATPPLTEDKKIPFGAESPPRQKSNPMCPFLCPETGDDGMKGGEEGTRCPLLSWR
jgi:hypothetical protein